MQRQSVHRIIQLSYLRTLLTLLVVAHHSVLAYTYISLKMPHQVFASAIPVSDTNK